MEALLGLLTGGNGWIAGLLAIVALIGGAYFKGKSAGKQVADAKKAAEYEKHLKDIAKASDARANAPTDDSVPDKYRRD